MLSTHQYTLAHMAPKGKMYIHERVIFKLLFPELDHTVCSRNISIIMRNNFGFKLVDGWS